eukprot:CAMPEP_0116563122 /NCGR_PEP_ID=MMETSP0397-20121206/12550_1 /TAXON_ID=216820 /ORGANISM="Cyclophora tenuis, Strain ECT3854" /LENGTH=154 /DNA_ID=CAMNT_0004089515 /DNA_START=82 /DNA_END=546 /DNA_ORIENTATION=-
MRDFVLRDYQRKQTAVQPPRQQQQQPQENNNNNIWKNFTRGQFFRRLARFVKHFYIVFPQNVTEVCYGGSFVVEPHRFDVLNETIWQKLQMTLQRGDNIEESHHMERTWAAVLSPPLTNPHHIEALWKHSTGIALRRGAIMGALKREVDLSIDE